MTELHSSNGRPQLILVGAGLANAIIAQRLSKLPNPPAMLMLEGSDLPFGEHTWSFHETDVSEKDYSWLAPLVAHRWEQQEVRFPQFSRILSAAYCSLTSQSVTETLARIPSLEIRTNAAVGDVQPDHVRLESGERLDAACVVDGRGYVPNAAMVLGYQKFVGLELATETPHGIEHPVIMDATVDQRDGYRFMYLLPFSKDRILVEDTRYSDGLDLAEDDLVHDIKAYTEAQGWRVARLVRKERGVLPIALAVDGQRLWNSLPEVPQSGMRASLFHATTGYSLPEAVRVANLIADAWPLPSPKLARLIRDHGKKRLRQQRFYRLLNRMLFRAAEPHKRHLVLQRFYGLGEDLIERFYAGTSTTADAARILVGKPPVPVRRALSCISENSLLKRETL